MCFTYKYCCNGEIGYLRTNSIDAARMKIFNKYLKKFGVANITEIKVVKDARTKQSAEKCN